MTDVVCREWWEPRVLGVDPAVHVVGRDHLNESLFEDASVLWWEGRLKFILDMTWGKGNFWSERMLLRHGPNLTRNDLHVEADGVTQHDYQRLPVKWANLFDVTVFDAPYMVKGTRSGHSFEDMNNAYGLGVAPRSVRALRLQNQRGLMEAERVTIPGGLIHVKYSDQVDGGHAHPGVFDVLNFGQMIGLEFLGRQIFHTLSPRSQPPRTKRGVPSVQQHPAQNSSELLTFRKYLNRRASK